VYKVQIKIVHERQS